MSDLVVYEDTIKSGQRAYSSLQKAAKGSFMSWKLVGAALEAGEKRLMQELRTNDIESRHFKKAYSLWLTESGFETITATVRHSLHEIMQNLPQIESWRNSLPPRRQAAHNPQAVIRAWRKATNPAKQGAERPILARMQLHSGKIKIDVAPVTLALEAGATRRQYDNLIEKLIAVRDAIPQRQRRQN